MLPYFLDVVEVMVVESGPKYLSGAEIFANLFYLVSVLLFIGGVVRLGKVKTAHGGNRMAMGAMGLAMVGQFIELGAVNPTAIIIGIVIGSLIGLFYAVRVQMTGMPELVALFNGFGGLASTLVALAYFGEEGNAIAETGSLMGIEKVGIVGAVALVVAVVVGSVTFTGSIVAWGKLNGKISGKPVQFTMHQGVNMILLVVTLVLGIAAIGVAESFGSVNALLIIITFVTLVLGVMLVLPIGGGDMPVVISLLNSYSGVAASMAGFAINSPVLIVAGALVGSAGLILTNIMCKAMNRSLANVLFGGFGDAPASGGGSAGKDSYENVTSTDAESAGMMFEIAQSCIIVPGYGMAVAQAQHAVRELAELMEGNGCEVRYAIHPVAGRMPGHMNVLLAEANVPYEALVEMDEINDDFKSTDIVLVIGANDVVNPAATDDPGSPIYGMPVLKVWEARSVYVIKRSLSPGFAGIKNPLFEAENNTMIFGDGKAVVEDLIKGVKGSD